MEILFVNDAYDVVENGEVLYTALSEDEAQGFIDWKNRPEHDAGNPVYCVTC